MNYYIVLFKNKQKRKIINKFKTLNRAKKYYDNLLQISDDVFFERQTENGDKCEYELALMENSKDNTNLYIKDNLNYSSQFSFNSYSEDTSNPKYRTSLIESSKKNKESGFDKIIKSIFSK